MKNQNAEGPTRDDDFNPYDHPYSGEGGSVGYTDEEMDRLNPHLVGKTPEEIRLMYLRTLHPGSMADEARWISIYNLTDQCRHSNALHDRNLSPSIARDDANGFYVGTYDQFRAPFFDISDGRDKAKDGEIIEQLLATQPHRIPAALLPVGAAPLPTYGPLMLPESVDPIAAAPNLPPAEVRPAQWAPEATMEEITAGVAREVLDCAALYVARIKVATGHRPDGDAIDQLRKLTTVIRNTQRIVRTAGKRNTRNLGGRPRKNSLPESIKVTTLKLEIAEKNKKHGIRKSATLTAKESVAELVNTPNFTESSNPS